MTCCTVNETMTFCLLNTFPCPPIPCRQKTQIPWWVSKPFFICPFRPLSDLISCYLLFISTRSSSTGVLGIPSTWPTLPHLSACSYLVAYSLSQDKSHLPCLHQEFAHMLSSVRASLAIVFNTRTLSLHPQPNSLYIHPTLFYALFL